MPDTDHSATEDEILTLVPQLRAYARALTRDPVNADDLVQETLVRALSHIGSYTPGTVLRAWLFTIMRNTFFTQHKKAQRERPGSETCVSGTVTSQPDHDRVLEGKRILAAINQLPDHYREVLCLVVILGESYQNAAQLCGIEIGTVKSRVNRARNLLIEKIGANTLAEFR